MDKATYLELERATDQIAELKAENSILRGKVAKCADLLEDAFIQMAYECEQGSTSCNGNDLSGWLDTGAISTCRDIGDALVSVGMYERHPDGYARRQFYRRKPDAESARRGE